jgi:hypothetical protein
MPSPLSVTKNNYIANPKRSDVPTPMWLCDFIADLYPDVKSVLDPCYGDTRMLFWFIDRGCKCHGCEIKHNSDFLGLPPNYFKGKIDLVVCNPPFNLGVGRKLGAEVFLEQIVKTCGKTQIALCVPMGFRLNQRWTSKRWKWLANHPDLEISSILSLPLDCYDGVQFHSEVIFFNSPHLKPHYWPDWPEQP